MGNYPEYVKPVTMNHQKSIPEVFEINIPILDTPTWVQPNSILSQIKIIKNSNFLIILIIIINSNNNKIITKKGKINITYRLFGLQSEIILVLQCFWPQCYSES